MEKKYSPAGRRWMRTVAGLSGPGSPSKLETVRRFYEHLSLKALDAEAVESDYGDVDMVVSNRTGVDVKGRNTVSVLRFALYQINRHAELARGFPYHQVFYLVYVYTNRRTRAFGNKPSKTEMARCRSEQEIRTMLYFNTTEVYLFDIELMVALSKNGHLKTGVFACRPDEKAVVISKADLRSLKTGKIFNELRLSRRRWQVIQEEIPLNFRHPSYPKRKVNLITAGLRRNLRFRPQFLVT